MNWPKARSPVDYAHHKAFFMAMYDNENTVAKSFDLTYITPYLIQAQWAEFIALKKRIHDLFSLLKRPLRILDIGVGNGRVAMHLSGVKEMWDMVACYHGTDNAQACIDLATENFEAYYLTTKAKAILLDAENLDQLYEQYDMIIVTWFTAGNFYPYDFDFEKYNSSNQRLDLSQNRKFTNIFRNAYKHLESGGEIIIGACYLDNDATRIKQEESYKKMGMEIITNPSDSFTATREGFWSQRFTKQKLFHYLPFVTQEKIEFIPLDTYDYAMQVIIKK